MLVELRVANFAIIDKVTVQFQQGLNVLSGETGSGKSVLLRSLALLMGEKSISDTIKANENQATVEGLFDLSQRVDIKKRLIQLGLAEAAEVKSVDDHLVVKRIISIDGKNRVYINGSLSTLQQLREIVSPLIAMTGSPAPLIEMTGQHDNRHLQSRSFHLEALDQYVGGISLRQKIEHLFTSLQEWKKQLTELEAGLRTRTQRLDFLTFQKDEIQAVGLKLDEEIELENQLSVLKNATKFTDFIEETESSLYGDDDSALVRLHRVLQKGEDLALHNAEFGKKLESLQQAKTLIEECVYELRVFGQNLNLDASQKEFLENRMSQWRKLQGKYGSTTTEVLSALQGIEFEIEKLNHSDNVCEELKTKILESEAEIQKWSLELHEMRRGGATTLAKSVNRELADLNMKGLIFGVEIRKSETLSSTGISEVEFVIQGSKSDASRSLAKFASGGELSRILLSLKCVVGASDQPRTYLFDEVDAGVSGLTAEKVGRKLKSIAKAQQIICITHLPQVAAWASSHYVIRKMTDKEKVKMIVQELDSSERVNEIARMLSGEKITKASLANARELLQHD